MAKVKMVKRFFRGTKSIICLECSKVVQDATNDLMIHMPYCGNCSKKIDDATQDYCGYCGERLDWP